jgi:hypothetical protein
VARFPRGIVRAEAESAERRRGKPIILVRGGAGGPTADALRRDYLIRNGGNATISDLWPWIVASDVNEPKRFTAVFGPGQDS